MPAQNKETEGKDNTLNKQEIWHGCYEQVFELGQKVRLTFCDAQKNFGSAFAIRSYREQGVRKSRIVVVQKSGDLKSRLRKHPGERLEPFGRVSKDPQPLKKNMDSKADFSSKSGIPKDNWPKGVELRRYRTIGFTWRQLWNLSGLLMPSPNFNQKLAIELHILTSRFNWVSTSILIRHVLVKKPLSRLCRHCSAPQVSVPKRLNCWTDSDSIHSVTPVASFWQQGDCWAVVHRSVSIEEYFSENILITCPTFRSDSTSRNGAQMVFNSDFEVLSTDQISNYSGSAVY
eukprot:Gb_12347 [translate_table: standard]